MQQRLDPRLVRPVGALTLLASLPITEAGLMALGSFWAEGDPVRTFLSAVASAGAILLLVAGACLIARRPLGHPLALVGAWASICACAAGAVIGLVGGHGLLYGVGFPLVIVALLRIPPEPQPEAVSTISRPNTDRSGKTLELIAVRA
jgi:hypothetical protein